MTEQEYFQVLEKVERDIEQGKITEAEKKLDSIVEVRPRRLKYEILVSKIAYAKHHDSDEVYQMLNEKSALMKEPGLAELFDLYALLAADCKDGVEVKRTKTIAAKMCLLVETNEKQKADAMQWLHQRKEEKEQCQNKILSLPWTVSLLLELQDQYLADYDMVMYLILLMVMQDKSMDTANEFASMYYQRPWVLELPNMLYLMEQLSKEHRAFVVMTGASRKDALIAAKALSFLGKEVIMMDQPIEMENVEGISMLDTLAVTIDNVETLDGEIILYHPVAFMDGNRMVDDNRAEILNYILQTKESGYLATVIAPGELMDSLSIHSLISKKIRRLGDYFSEAYESQMTFGWFGNYLTYTDELYGINSYQELTKPSQVDYSIVIPARNSSETLQYTIQTCLHQRYKGTYEVLISDNSTDGNQEIKELCNRLADEHIRYIKTPRNFRLSRSFEFAYLKARGDFIISIGSDDAIFPWTLEVIDGVRKVHPQEKVFRWDRGFYAWPGFNGGQEHEFLIPGKYEAGKVLCEKEYGKNKIAMILLDANKMYGLPMLYINSGFSRDFLQTVLDKTGCLVDGICQDIYMGMVVSSICESILYIQYPLSLAALSPRSIGYQANLSAVDQKSQNEKLAFAAPMTSEGVGGYSKTLFERLFPDTGTDVSSLYSCFLRMISLGLLPQQYLTEVFDWKKNYITSLQMHQKQDLKYDKIVYQFQGAADRLGQDFSEWFHKIVFPKAMKPEVFNQTEYVQQVAKKTYTPGPFNDQGAMMYDASEYGVTNVKEAAELFEKLTGL